MNFLRAATERSGVLTAVGQVIHGGRRQAVAEGRLEVKNRATGERANLPLNDAMKMIAG